MLAALPSPVLCLAVDGMKDVQGGDALQSLWTLFTKCKENIQDGRRLENISWRLWYREMAGGQATPDSVYPSNLWRSPSPPDLLSPSPSTALVTNPFFAGFSPIPNNAELDNRAVSVPCKPPLRTLSSESAGQPRSLGKMICEVLASPQVPSLIARQSASLTKYTPPTPGEEPLNVSTVNLTRIAAGSTPRNTLTSSPSRHIHPLVVNILTPTPNLSPHPTPPATPILQPTELDEAPSPCNTTSSGLSTSPSQLSLLSHQTLHSNTSAEDAQTIILSPKAPPMAKTSQPSASQPIASLAPRSAETAAPLSSTKDRRFFLKQSPDDDSPERRDPLGKSPLSRMREPASSSPRNVVLSDSPQPISPLAGADPRSLESHTSQASRVSHTSHTSHGHAPRRTLGAKHKVPGRPTVSRFNHAKKATTLKRAVSEGSGAVTRDSSQETRKAPAPPPEVKPRAAVPTPLVLAPVTAKPTEIDLPKSLRTAAFTLGSESSVSTRSDMAETKATSAGMSDMGPPPVPSARVASPRAPTFQTLQPLATIRSVTARPPTPPRAYPPPPPLKSTTSAPVKPSAKSSSVIYDLSDDEDDDFEDDEDWNSEDVSVDSADVEVPIRPNHTRNTTATKATAHKQAPIPTVVKKSRRELAEEARQRETEFRLLKAAEEAQRQQDMFKKAPVKSYSNLAALNRTQSGLLSQLLRPDTARFAAEHPARTMSAADLSTPFASSSRPPPSQHSRQSSAGFGRPMMQQAKSAAVVPTTAAITTTGTSISTNGSGGYRPKGRPQDMEMEDDSDDSGDDDIRDKIELSRSAAQVKLDALAGRRSSSKGSSKGSERGPSSSAAPATSISPVHSEPTAIPIGHPYNLPAPPAPSTPRTTRRNMLSNELSESLRRNLLWERRQTGSGIGVPRRHNSSGLLSNAVRPMTSVLAQQKEPQITPAVLPSAPLTRRARSSGLISTNGAGIQVTEKGVTPNRVDQPKEQARGSNARSWTNDYHMSGW